MSSDIPLIEPLHCIDIFADGVARVERLPGGNIRIVLFCEQQGHDGMERIIVARIVGSASNLPLVVRKLAESVGVVSLN